MRESFLRKAGKRFRAFGTRHWRSGAVLLSVILVFAGFCLLAPPAVTMEQNNPQVEAEYIYAPLGEALTTRITARDQEDGVYYLLVQSENAGLSGDLDFRREQAQILDSTGEKIVLHREYVSDGETGYWFTMDQEQARLELSWENGELELIQDQEELPVSRSRIVKRIRAGSEEWQALAASPGSASDESTASPSEADQDRRASESSGREQKKASGSSAGEELQDLLLVRGDPEEEGWAVICAGWGKTVSMAREAAAENTEHSVSLSWLTEEELGELGQLYVEDQKGNVMEAHGKTYRELPFCSLELQGQNQGWIVVEENGLQALLQAELEPDGQERYFYYPLPEKVKGYLDEDLLTGQGLEQFQFQFETFAGKDVLFIHVSPLEKRTKVSIPFQVIFNENGSYLFEEGPGAEVRFATEAGLTVKATASQASCQEDGSWTWDIDVQVSNPDAGSVLNFYLLNRMDSQNAAKISLANFRPHPLSREAKPAPNFFQNPDGSWQSEEICMAPGEGFEYSFQAILSAEQAYGRDRSGKVLEGLCWTEAHQEEQLAARISSQIQYTPRPLPKAVESRLESCRFQPDQGLILTYRTLLNNSGRLGQERDRWTVQFEGIEGASYVTGSLKIGEAEEGQAESQGDLSLDQDLTDLRLLPASQSPALWDGKLKLEEQEAGFTLTADYRRAEVLATAASRSQASASPASALSQIKPGRTAYAPSYYLTYQAVIPEDRAGKLKEKTIFRNTLSAYEDGALLDSAVVDYLADPALLPENWIPLQPYVASQELAGNQGSLVEALWDQTGRPMQKEWDGKYHIYEGQSYTWTISIYAPRGLQGPGIYYHELPGGIASPEIQPSQITMQDGMSIGTMRFSSDKKYLILEIPEANPYVHVRVRVTMTVEFQPGSGESYEDRFLVVEQPEELRRGIIEKTGGLNDQGRLEWQIIAHIPGWDGEGDYDYGWYVRDRTINVETGMYYPDLSQCKVQISYGNKTQDLYLVDKTEGNRDIALYYDMNDSEPKLYLVTRKDTHVCTEPLDGRPDGLPKEWCTDWIIQDDVVITFKYEDPEFQIEFIGNEQLQGDPIINRTYLYSNNRYQSDFEARYEIPDLPSILQKSKTGGREFTLEINQGMYDLSGMDQLNIRDTMTGMIYQKGSMVIQGEDMYGVSYPLRQGLDYTLEASSDLSILDIQIKDPGQYTYRITYQVIGKESNQEDSQDYANRAEVILFGSTFTQEIHGVQIRPESTGEQYEIRIHKTDSEDSEKEVSGADYGVFHSNGELLDVETTDQQGRARFQCRPDSGFLLVRDQLYYIQETGAPPGYELSGRKYWFYYDNSDAELIRMALEEARAAGLFQEEDRLVAVSGGGLESSASDGEEAAGWIEVQDRKGYRLPHAGGSGAWREWYTMTGMLLCVSAACVLYRKNNNPKRRKKK